MSPATIPPQEANASVNVEPKAKPRLSMAVINFWLDAGLFVALAVVMWTTAIMAAIFPTPTRAAGWSLWGLNYDQWHFLHVGALFVFAALAVEHLALHWNWVCTIVSTKILRAKSRPDEGTQAVIGVGVFIGVMLIILATLVVALFTVQSSAPNPPHPNS